MIEIITKLRTLLDFLISKVLMLAHRLDTLRYSTGHDPLRSGRVEECSANVIFRIEARPAL